MKYEWLLRGFLTSSNNVLKTILISGLINFKKYVNLKHEIWSANPNWKEKTNVLFDKLNFFCKILWIFFCLLKHIILN